MADAEELYNESELQGHSKLILCIEEQIDGSSVDIDNRLFIGWDRDRQLYFIKGKRVDSPRTNYVPYSFTSENKYDIYDFIKFLVSDNPVNIILYNYNNLYDKDLSNVIYEFFENLMDRRYELSGYDDDRLNKRSFFKYLRFIKYIYNT